MGEPFEDDRNPAIVDRAVALALKLVRDIREVADELSPPSESGKGGQADG